MSSIFAHTSLISLLFSMSLKISVIFDDRLPLLSNPSLASLACVNSEFNIWQIMVGSILSLKKNIANHGRIKNKTAELCPKLAQCTCTPVHQGISTPGSVHQAWQEIMASIIQPPDSALAHLYKMSLGLKTSLCGPGLK